MIVTEPEKKEYELAPEGMINAVCVDVIDVGQAMGLSPDKLGRYLVQPKDPTHKAKARVRLIFELENRMEDGRPFTTHLEVPCSFYKPRPGGTGQTAKLRDQLENWGIKLPADIGEPGTSMDLAALLLGQQAALRIKHNPDKAGRMWANISAVNPSNAVVEPSGEWDSDAARSRLRDRALKATVSEAVEATKGGDAPY
tara:strand:- start:2159 stop:2752 length:594 start_codon:yes stop_codon:yes gene_type:complete